jgi:hypothetical protein
MGRRQRGKGVGRGARAQGACGCVALLLALAMVVSIVPASIAATPADRAATQTYLQAGYRLAKTLVKNVDASRASVAALVTRLGGECHGVLASAPKEEPGPSKESSLSARARGELQRSELQQQTIDGELRGTFVSSIYQPDRLAIESYAATVTPLTWSDPQIASLVRFASTSIEEPLSPVPDVCEQMKGWAGSGYHLLSPASRAFASAQHAGSAARPEGSIASLLAPYEDSRERALIRRTRALQTKLAGALKRLAGGYSSLLRALGVPESPFEDTRKEPVLGRGTTRAGTTFVVRRQAPSEASSSCRRSVSVEFTERHGGSSSSVCLGGNSDRQPSGGCGGGIQSIQAAVPASVRTGRLLLSNGQTITSSVVRVPRNAGGPGGVYVQEVRGYSPYPVSLTELNAGGNVVKVVGLEKLRCARETAAMSPTLVDLAQSTTPDGEPFSIQGISVHPNRGPASLFLLPPPVGVQRSSSEEGAERTESGSFTWSLALECPPHPFVIVYGILSPPDASVLARTPAGLVPLTVVPIDPNLHSNGPLAYGVFTSVPSELIVHSSNGSTLYAESLAVRAKEETEFCEGYAEG